MESSIRDHVANICLIPKVLKKSCDIFDNFVIIFDFNTLKTSLTGAISDQYAGKNIILNFIFCVMLFVSLDLLILASSKITIFKSWLPSSSCDKILSKIIIIIQKANEFIVFDYLMENYFNQHKAQESGF